jgi:hypothetical protein
MNTPYLAAVIVLAVVFVVALVAARVRRHRKVTGGYDMAASAGNSNPLGLLTTQDDTIDQAIRRRMLLTTISEARLESDCTDGRRKGAALVENAAFLDPRVVAVNHRSNAPQPPAPHPLAPDEHESDDQDATDQYLDVGGVESSSDDRVNDHGDDSRYGNNSILPPRQILESRAGPAPPQGPTLMLWEPEVYVNEDGDTEA